MTTTPNLSTVDQARLRSGANDLAGMAATYGVEMPAAHKRALQVAVEARRMAMTDVPPLALPAKASQTAQTIRKAASERLLAAETAAAASELATLAEMESYRQAHAAIPAIFTALQKEFDEARDTFARLAETAPLEVTSETTPEGANQHVELLRVVGRLTSAAYARHRLAQVNGETVKGEAVLWLVLDPKPETNLSEIRAAISPDLPTDLPGWLRLVHLGCSLAHDDEAQRRAETFGRAVYAAGWATPDGGTAERTYGEALALLRRADAS